MINETDNVVVISAQQGNLLRKTKQIRLQFHWTMTKCITFYTL